MPGQLQDSGVGEVVLGGGSEDRGTIRDYLNPSTDAGQAMMVAGAAFVLLLLTVGKSSKGAGKLLAVGYFVLIVALADGVAHWAARTWNLRHPDGIGSSAITILY
jgi:hypothetical protein